MCVTSQKRNFLTQNTHSLHASPVRTVHSRQTPKIARLCVKRWKSKWEIKPNPIRSGGR
jgi:hypothetical protein